jgi:hypothetical protein
MESPVEDLGVDGMPEEFRHLSERERVQGLALQRMFAEQEHGLRQSYADWIIRVLGVQLLVADLVFVIAAWATWCAGVGRPSARRGGRRGRWLGLGARSSIRGGVRP